MAPRVRAFFAVFAVASGAEINDSPMPEPSKSRKNVTETATKAPTKTARQENSAVPNPSFCSATITVLMKIPPSKQYYGGTGG
jgi:hypothetical protein